MRKDKLGGGARSGEEGENTDEKKDEELWRGGKCIGGKRGGEEREIRKEEKVT